MWGWNPFPRTRSDKEDSPAVAAFGFEKRVSTLGFLTVFDTVMCAKNYYRMFATIAAVILGVRDKAVRGTG